MLEVVLNTEEEVMSVENVEKQLKNYNEQIEALQSKMFYLKEEIKEAEEAFENAQKFHGDFNTFVNKAGNIKESLLENISLKSVVSFTGKIADILTGKEYNAAENKFLEINEYIKSEIIRMEAEYEECKQQCIAILAKMDAATLELDKLKREQSNQ